LVSAMANALSGGSGDTKSRFVARGIRDVYMLIHCYADFQPVIDVKELQASSKLERLWERVLTEQVLPGLCDDPQRREDILRHSVFTMMNGFNAIVAGMTSDGLGPSMMQTAEGMRGSEASAMSESEGPNRKASDHPDTPSSQTVPMVPMVSEFEAARHIQNWQAETHASGQQGIGLLPEDDTFNDGNSGYVDHSLLRDWS
jgi:hypothetical protein